RGAILEEVPRDKRLVVDTGNFLGGETEQDIIKFGFIIQALNMLGYDVVNLTEDDVAIARDLGLLEGNSFDIISHAFDTEVKGRASWKSRLRIGEQTVLVTIAAVNAESDKIDSVEKFFDAELAGLGLNILIINDCSDDVVDRIVATGVVDVLICPALADEPVILDMERKKPLVLSVGQLGKYIGKLTVHLGEEQELRLDYTKVPIDEKLPADLMVKEENLLEKVIKVPLPNGLEYLGSTSCNSCHKYEYEKWSTKRHAAAYQTLVDVGSQYDPECVSCHVVGLEYETGFVSQKSPEDLRNVGCEICHGPGSKHMTAILMAQEQTGISEPQSTCIDCHTPEHSNYQGREDEYLAKIVHWKEPKQDADVKK
ncbi:MAG: multiheme c-type cytochrome, partial [Planctomycetota bacterium]